MKKSIREAVYKMFDGRCAYCGQEITIKNFQVDHKVSKAQFLWGRNDNKYNFDLNDIQNLYPSCVVCNHYKRSLTVDGFRSFMEDFQRRYIGLPKKTVVDRTIKRIQYMQRVADRYGITKDQTFKGFYFERVGHKVSAV